MINKRWLSLMSFLRVSGLEMVKQVIEIALIWSTSASLWKNWRRTRTKKNKSMQTRKQMTLSLSFSADSLIVQQPRNNGTHSLILLLSDTTHFSIKVWVRTGVCKIVATFQTETETGDVLLIHGNVVGLMTYTIRIHPCKDMVRRVPYLTPHRKRKRRLGKNTSGMAIH